MVAGRERRIALVIVRRGRLWREKVQIDVLFALRKIAERERLRVMAIQNQIELRKVTLGFRLGLVVGIRKPADGTLGNRVAGRLRKIQAVGDERAVKVQSRLILCDTNKLAALKAQVRQKVVEFEVPAIASAPGLDPREAADELSKLAGVWVLKNLHCFNRVDRKIQTEVSRGRIVGVDSVYKQRALLFGCAFDAQLTFGRTNDAGDKWQRLVDSRGGQRQCAHCLAFNVSCRR